MDLADDFQIAERPVVLVELAFDSGDINLWTRPFTGEYQGKVYSPIAGLTGSLSIRQSLDRPSLDAGAQIVGASPEIKNAALTEDFQQRAARIILGAIDDNGDISSSETILRGTMQDIPMVSDAEKGFSMSVQIESVFGDINVARDLRLSAADQATIDANDTVFDFVETATLTEPRFGG